MPTPKRYVLAGVAWIGRRWHESHYAPSGPTDSWNCKPSRDKTMRQQKTMWQGATAARAARVEIGKA
eukprot:2368713-Pyramimonas_sp.AAC.1